MKLINSLKPEFKNKLDASSADTNLYYDVAIKALSEKDNPDDLTLSEIIAISGIVLNSHIKLYEVYFLFEI